jgi:hypothetical protein
MLFKLNTAVSKYQYFTEVIIIIIIIIITATTTTTSD